MSACVDCNAEAPEAQSDYSLIAAGWRILQRQNADGSRTLVWRCPRCWAEHKAKFGTISGSWPRTDGLGKDPAGGS